MVPEFPFPLSNACSEAREEALNLYLDGELPGGEEVSLFTHLASCASCRQCLSATMEFRRMSRQEAITVPPSVDEAFFQRLDQIKRRYTVLDRVEDRRPLWHIRTPVSLRVAATVAFLLFIAGFLFPREIGDAPLEVSSAAAYVEGFQERVEFAPLMRYRVEPIYVFYPGLTVEATREQVPVPGESM